MNKNIYEDRIIFLKECIDMINKQGLNRKILEKIFQELLISKNNKSNYYIISDGDRPYYGTKCKAIICSVKGIVKYSNVYLNNLEKDLYLYDANLFRSYLCLLIILHEIVHYYQFNDSKLLNSFSDKYSFMNDFYVDYTNFLDKNSDRLFNYRFKKYIKNEYNYFIERNASVEALYMLKDVCNVANNELMDDYISNLILDYEGIGYRTYHGSIYNSYKDTFRLRKFKKIYNDYNVDFLSKLRYGLPLDYTDDKLYFDRINSVKKRNAKILRVK